MRRLSGKDIISYIRKGKEDDVLKYLYKRVFYKVKSYICRNCGNEDEAMDIFQDGVIKVYQELKNDNYNPSYDIEGYLYSICRNLWINYAKKQNRMIRIPEGYDSEADHTDFSEMFMTNEESALVMEVIEKLGKKCFELLKFSVYYKLPNSEICEKMGFSTENAVKTRKYKCKQKLLAIMDQSRSVQEVLGHE